MQKRANLLISKGGKTGKKLKKSKRNTRRNRKVGGLILPNPLPIIRTRTPYTNIIKDMQSLGEEDNTEFVKAIDNEYTKYNRQITAEIERIKSNSGFKLVDKLFRTSLQENSNKPKIELYETIKAINDKNYNDVKEQLSH